jgi:hypothetical protein
MFRVVFPPIIRSVYNCIYSIWYLSHRYCYLPLSWKSWNRFECAVGGVTNKLTTMFMVILFTVFSTSCFGRYCCHLQGDVIITRTKRYKYGHMCRVYSIATKIIIISVEIIYKYKHRLKCVGNKILGVKFVYFGFASP